MSTEKTEAIIIRMADFSESSRVVTLFTRDFGKVSVVAKGGRRLKGPFEAALDLLTTSRIVFIRKSTSSLDILTEAQLIKRFRPNGTNLVSLYAGYYVAELLSGLTEEYDPHPYLFSQALETLDQLSLESNAKLAIIRFELFTLQEIGQLPDFNECTVCRNSVAEGNSFRLWVSQGGLICSHCQKEGYSGKQIQAGTVAILRRLADTSDTTSQRMVVSPQQIQEIRHLVTAAICNALERRPKMLRYLQF